MNELNVLHIQHATLLRCNGKYLLKNSIALDFDYGDRSPCPHRPAGNCYGRYLRRSWE